MKKILVMIILIGFSNPFNAQQLQQNHEETEVTFKIRNFGFAVDGKFDTITITSIFNKNNLNTSFIKAQLKVSSINTDLKKRDQHLLDSDYFDVENFPEIAFQSTAITFLSANNYVLKADVIIKGITKQIEIPIEIIETTNSITMKTNFVVNRLDFEVGEKSWVLSDNVKVNVLYTAKK